VTAAGNPPRCETCGKRVRPWQRYDGVGPLGFTRRTAAMLWHSKCGLERPA